MRFCSGKGGAASALVVGGRERPVLGCRQMAACELEAAVLGHLGSSQEHILPLLLLPSAPNLPTSCTPRLAVPVPDAA